MIGGQGRALGHKMAVTLALARLPLPTALGLQLCQHQWHEPLTMPEALFPLVLLSIDIYYDQLSPTAPQLPLGPPGRAPSSEAPP